MFFGTLRTSFGMLALICRSQGACVVERTATGELDEVELLALLGPRNVRGDERVHEGLEIGAPPLGEGVADLPLVVNALARELRADGCKALIQPRFEAVDLFDVVRQVVAGAADVNIRFGECVLYTHSLKKALAICSMRMCGWLCSWQTSTPSQVRRMPFA